MPRSMRGVEEGDWREGLGSWKGRGERKREVGAGWLRLRGALSDPASPGQENHLHPGLGVEVGRGGPQRHSFPSSLFLGRRKGLGQRWGVQRGKNLP